MESNIWLEKFKAFLSEYGATPSEIDDIILTMDTEIKIAHERNADPESAVIRIGKAFFKAKKDVEAKEAFDHYSTHHPKIFSLKHCLDTVFSRMECLNTYLEHLRSESNEKHGSCHQINSRLKICEEYYNVDTNIIAGPEFSNLAALLVKRLNTTKDKILLVSILKSKYSVICEVLSIMSQIPVKILEIGIPDEMDQERWDALTIAMDELNDAQLFLMDLSEPIELEALIEDLKKAQQKGGFDVIVISGLSYLYGNHQDDLFDISCRLLSGFADEHGINIFIVP